MGKYATLVQKIHRRQQLRHIVANKLTAALTALRYVQEGQSISPKFLERAICDLEALMELVDKEDRERGR